MLDIVHCARLLFTMGDLKIPEWDRNLNRRRNPVGKVTTLHKPNGGTRGIVALDTLRRYVGPPLFWNHNPDISKCRVNTIGHDMRDSHDRGESKRKSGQKSTAERQIWSPRSQPTLKNHRTLSDRIPEIAYLQTARVFVLLCTWTRAIYLLRVKQKKKKNTEQNCVQVRANPWTSTHVQK